MLVYSNCDKVEITEYADIDFTGSPNEMKSTSGYVFKLVGGAISWESVI